MPRPLGKDDLRMCDQQDLSQPQSVDPMAGLRKFIEAMSAGSEAALAQLYAATVSSVYGLSLRITGNRELAEEVTATTYWQAWMLVRHYEPCRGSPAAWLLSIARSRALDALRKTNVFEVSLSDEALADRVSYCFENQNNPQDILLAIERSTLLHAAMQKLEPLSRQLVSLAFFKGMTHLEISRHTELPLGTVKSNIRRAMELLRGILDRP